MKRDEEDVFSPAVQPAGPPLAMAPAGPTAAWTAQGVIGALEPLVVDKRLERLRGVLSERVASVTVVLDNPHDPHNGSAVLRSCDAFGVQRVHVVTESEEFLASRMVALGSQRWVDVIQHTTANSAVEQLRSEGYQILVTHPEGKLSVDDLKNIPRAALVLGNEHAGVGETLTEAADNTIAIPMCGFVESLNVSVSAAILVQAATSGRSGDLSPEQRDNLYARWLRNSVPRSEEVLSSLEAS